MGWTRMTLSSQDSCTEPATMATVICLRAQDIPARYIHSEEGDTRQLTDHTNRRVSARYRNHCRPPTGASVTQVPEPRPGSVRQEPEPVSSMNRNSTVP